MGLKGLWSLLQPVAKNISLNDFKDMTVGIDAPIWVQQAKRQFCPVNRLFILRIVKLFQVGVKALKSDTCSNRRYMYKRYGKNTAKFKAAKKKYTPAKIVDRGNLPEAKPLSKLLESLGITFIESEGESEATLAQLNQRGIVDVIVTEDVDAFLFGALSVVRGFSIAKFGRQMKSYQINDINSQLNLDREKLVAFAIMCGCDYDPKGVPGLGPLRAFQFLTSWNEGPILDRLRTWKGVVSHVTDNKQKAPLRKSTRLDKRTTGLSGRRADLSLEHLSHHSTLALENKLSHSELCLVQKAIKCDTFPNEAAIDAFMNPPENEIKKLVNLWQRPDLSKFQRITKGGNSYLSEFATLLEIWESRQRKRKGIKSTKTCLKERPSSSQISAFSLKVREVRVVLRRI